jgi:thiamine biosynthesis lipoprotein ApbE
VVLLVTAVAVTSLVGAVVTSGAPAGGVEADGAAAPTVVAPTGRGTEVAVALVVVAADEVLVVELAAPGRVVVGLSEVRAVAAGNAGPEAPALYAARDGR